MGEAKPPDVHISVRWVSEGRKARNPPNPAYPAGVVVDLAGPGARHCPVPLRYPAGEVGTWLLRCHTCGFVAAVTAAGRTDDPREVRMGCKPIGAPVGSA